MNLLDQATKQKGEELMKRFHEEAKAEGFVLDAVLMSSMNSIVAVPVVRPQEKKKEPVSPGK